jgi:CMP-N-acetylneuraminic acid synthetase
MKIIAIVPIKHNSSRVPGKNFREFNGKPLYYWIINTLLQVEEINQIVIDTNSDVIKEGVPKFFSMDKIVIYDRPEHLWSGDTPTNALLTNVINDLELDADYYFQTHTTNPLLKPETIKDAIQKFKESDKETLFSVKTHHTRFYDKDGKDMNHNRFHLIPTQDLDPIYEENSCMYLFTKDILEKYGARIGENALLYPMSDIESQDIDWEDDFKEKLGNNISFV